MWLGARGNVRILLPVVRRLVIGVRGMVDSPAVLLPPAPRAVLPSSIIVTTLLPVLVQAVIGVRVVEGGRAGVPHPRVPFAVQPTTPIVMISPPVLVLGGVGITGTANIVQGPAAAPPLIIIPAPAKVPVNRWEENGAQPRICVILRDPLPAEVVRGERVPRVRYGHVGVPRALPMGAFGAITIATHPAMFVGEVVVLIVRRALLSIVRLLPRARG